MSDQLTTSGRQLSLLIARGMITHILAPPTKGMEWSIDPQKIRAVEELSLMVILDDGTVAISCPNGLPKNMADTALPIESLPSVQKQDALPKNNEILNTFFKSDEFLSTISKIDFIKNGLESISTQVIDDAHFRKTDPNLENILDRLAGIESSISSLEKLTTAKANQTTIENSAALREIKSLSDSLKALPASLRDNHALLEVEKRTSEIQDSIKLIQQDSLKTEDIQALERDLFTKTKLSEFKKFLETIDSKVDMLSRAHPPRLEITPIHKAIARQTTAISTVVRRLETAISELQSTSNQSSQNDEHQSAKESPSIIEKKSPNSDQISHLTKLTEQLYQDLSTFAIEAQTTKDSGVYHLEMIALRRQLARHATAHATVLKRLEAAINSLAAWNLKPNAEDFETEKSERVLDELSKIINFLEHINIQTGTASNVALTHEEVGRFYFDRIWKKDTMKETNRIKLAEQIACKIKSLQ